jgi:hypothetical protein
LVADVKKAFHQIELDKFEREFLIDGFGWKTPTILNQYLSLIFYLFILFILFI